MIKDSYKSRTSKEKHDINIPLSVQPWGEDGDKRKYWLIEGQDDTSFRVYRESDLTARKEPRKDNTTWFSVAGSIDELRVLATKLADEDGSRKAKALSERILNAIPRFEATEEVRATSSVLTNITAHTGNPSLCVTREMQHSQDLLYLVDKLLYALDKLCGQC